MSSDRSKERSPAGKAETRSPDAGRRVDITVVACGSSISMASVFSMKNEAKPSAESQEVRKCEDLSIEHLCSLI